MKTFNLLKRLPKALFMLSLVSVISTGCGNNNRSGGSNNNNNPAPFAPINPNGGVFNTNLQVLNLLRQIPCLMGEQRVPVNLPVQIPNFNIGATFVGTSTYGDIAVITSQGQTPVLQMEICQRQQIGMSNQPMLQSNIHLNNSLRCNVGEITSANVSFQSQFGPVPVGFNNNHLNQVCSQTQF